MAAVGAEVAGPWFLSSGGVGFFIILLLLSVFLTALCSNCGRRSFKLQHAAEDKNPSTLVRVGKLEETRAAARENPMINEIQNDEKGSNTKEQNPVPYTPWRSHLRAPQDKLDVPTNGSGAVKDIGGDAISAAAEESKVQQMLRRSRLRASQTQGVNSSFPPESDHIYHTIGGGQRDADVSLPPTNQELWLERNSGRERGTRFATEDFNDRDRNSLYAQVSKRVRQPEVPGQTVEVVLVVEEDPSPPLPDRRAEMEAWRSGRLE
ncbi:uncharacterized protein LOC108894297 isoform X1 [Lates calcarifer]|uniref:Uncharacterized protein LOC108894297 isoform X1 n=1 Tax=Lates calcarifer TaxID=8187 RepID=A0AAJ7Q6X5_LATCA|nr:uncharacterized protein LOC108894297 isoform X1 [Lates calcarifer]